jgi:hypothetical protein
MVETTKEVVLEHARQFKNRDDWVKACRELQKQGYPLYYRWAYARGQEFFKQCISHMTFHIQLKKRHLRLKAWWRKLTDEQLLEDAKKYHTKNEWKKGNYWYCLAAYNRGRDFYSRCCSHMVAAANPYNTPYSIYVFEFADNYAYVGLSFQPEKRKVGHFKGGPVKEHLEICLAYSWRILQNGIQGPLAAGEAERKWIEQYQSTGWKMLNSAQGGATGGISSQYSDNDIIEDALHYQTKNTWKLAHRHFWVLAKARGIFEQCVAHMPRRATRVPVLHTEETKKKLKTAAQKRVANPVWRENHSKTMKQRYDTLRLVQVA